MLSKLLARFEAFPAFSKQEWEEPFKKLVEEEGIKMGQFAQPVRVALTGRTASPGLFEVMEVLGARADAAPAPSGDRAGAPKRAASQDRHRLDGAETVVYYCWTGWGIV